MAHLDAPGEYVCIDVGGGKSQFSYIPFLSGEAPDVSVSQLTILIEIQAVANLIFDGVKFEHSSSGGVDGYNWGSESALRIKSSQNIYITDCQFSLTGLIGLSVMESNNVHVTKSAFCDIGFHAIMLYNQQSNNDEESMMDITIDNNIFNGCGINSFWAPACVYGGGNKNITIRNNEFTNSPWAPVQIRGFMHHGANYWEDNGVIEPTREDYVFHIELNYIHDNGLGILSDFGAVYTGKYERKRSIFCYARKYKTMLRINMYVFDSQ